MWIVKWCITWWPQGARIPPQVLTVPLEHSQAHRWILWKAYASLHDPPLLFTTRKEPRRMHLKPWALKVFTCTWLTFANSLLVPVPLLFLALEIFHSEVSSGSFFINWFITVATDQMIDIFCLSLLVEISSSQVPVVGLKSKEDNKKQVHDVVFKTIEKFKNISLMPFLDKINAF